VPLRHPVTGSSEPERDIKLDPRLTREPGSLPRNRLGDFELEPDLASSWSTTS